MIEFESEAACELAAHGMKRRRRALAAACCGVAAVVAAVFWPVLDAQGVFLDDDFYLSHNPLVRQPGWESARRFVTEVFRPSTVGGYYHPVAMISLMLDYALGGRPDDYTVFHADALLIHIGTTIMVVLFLHQLFGQVWPAALVGLLFGLHPLAVEPVAWISSRKALLAGAFSMACLVSWLQYVRCRCWWSYGLSLLFLLLALASKPSAMPLPAILLLLDWWPLRRVRCGDRDGDPDPNETVRTADPAGAARKRWNVLVEKIPHFALAALFVFITYKSHISSAFIAEHRLYSVWQAPLVMCSKLAFCAGKFFWPAGLTGMYPPPVPFSLNNPFMLFSVLIVIAAAAASLLLLRRTRALAAGALFVTLSLGPVLGAVQYGAHWIYVFDSYMYFTMVGILLVLAAGMAELWRRTEARSPARIALLAAVAVLAAAESIRARSYLAVWNDTVALHRHALEHAPDSAAARSHLAWRLYERGVYPEAARLMDEAVHIEEDYAEGRNKLALIYRAMDRPDLALSEYFTAIEINPNYIDPRINIVDLLLALDRPADALPHAQAALRINERDARSFIALAKTLIALNDQPGAEAAARRAMELNPELVDGPLSLGAALANQRRDTEAIAAYDAALALDLRDPQIYMNKSYSLLRLGRVDEALIDLDTALRLRPDYAEALSARGAVYESIGRLEEAEASYRAAAELQPLNVESWLSLGQLLERMERREDAVEQYRRCLRMDPDFDTARSKLIYALIFLDRVEDAAREADAFQALRPASAEAHMLVGIAAAAGLQTAEALAAYHRAIELNPDYLDAHVNLAILLGNLGRFDEAIVSMARALELAPDRPLEHMRMGHLCEQAGRIEAARAAYQRALQLSPDLTEAKKRLEALAAQNGG